MQEDTPLQERKDTVEEPSLLDTLVALILPGIHMDCSEVDGGLRLEDRHGFTTMITHAKILTHFEFVNEVERAGREYRVFLWHKFLDVDHDEQ